MSDPVSTNLPQEPQEPSITINGHTLTVAQAMTVRVAIGAFAMDLQDGMGDDDHGRAMTEGYLIAIRSIVGFMTQRAAAPCSSTES
jgi:hypothetical protein